MKFFIVVDNKIQQNNDNKKYVYALKCNRNFKKDYYEICRQI